MPSETVRGTPDGDDLYCLRCRSPMPIKVLQSAAGFYLGVMCGCGPYSRESRYFATEHDAAVALRAWQGGETWMLR